MRAIELRIGLENVVVEGDCMYEQEIPLGPVAIGAFPAFHTTVDLTDSNGYLVQKKGITE